MWSQLPSLGVAMTPEKILISSGIEAYSFSTPIGFFVRTPCSRKSSIGLQIPNERKDVCVLELKTPYGTPRVLNLLGHKLLNSLLYAFANYVSTCRPRLVFSPAGETGLRLQKLSAGKAVCLLYTIFDLIGD